MQEDDAMKKTPLWITTWNVLNEGYENPEYYSEESHPFLHWDQGRRDRAKEYIKSITLDVTCLQEVSHKMLDELMSNDTYQKPHAFSYTWEPRTDASKKTQDGLAIIWKSRAVTLLRKFSWRYPSGGHIFLACLFEYNDSTMQQKKSQFWCVNTHVNWATRETDLLELKKQLDSHAEFLASPAPKIIVGDFNAERHEDWYKAIVGGDSLVDALVERSHPYSYNSGKNKKWIDYVLLQGIAVEDVGCTIVGGTFPPEPYQFKDASLPNNSVPSDHVPITVGLLCF
jgi:mRNA deadenylase 3'-5' endonuclease subunit Ccr4